ncbi:molecular chaperone [uncultured Slackia sp.]|uniref:TorD/DmsD family molecular chaperone n=1 Tax=uncultured Slackia sp. TaxID=665903 RepID=UPI0025D5F6FD|nr:molecular chaperone TorD family protein [uncultured Slackia sp.]
MTESEIYAQLADACESRANTYQFLSRLYQSEIDEDLLNELEHMSFPYGSGNAKLDEGYMRMAKFMSNTWPNTLTDLAIDYVRSFIGHGNDSYSCAYPYESVYTSRERLMMMGARDMVLAIYRSQNLDKRESWKEGEDHVAVELEFMATMAARSADAFRAGDAEEAETELTVQRNFLTDHLLAWVPMMTADLARFAKTDFYLGLAYVTEGFLGIDDEFFAELFEENDD